MGWMPEFRGREVPRGEAVYTLLEERWRLARLPWLNPVSFRSSVLPPAMVQCKKSPGVRKQTLDKFSTSSLFALLTAAAPAEPLAGYPGEVRRIPPDLKKNGFSNIEGLSIKVEQGYEIFTSPLPSS